MPLQPAAVRFALERLDRPTWPWRLARLAGLVGLGKQVLARRFPVGVGLQPEAESLLRALRELTGEPGPFVTQLGSRGDVVVFLLHGPAPTAVAKISADRARLEREATALREVGDGARAAGADLPRPLREDRLDGAAVLLESPVAGRPLARVLAGAARRLPAAAERLADWLVAWHRGTAQQVDLNRELLETLVVAPARSVAEAIGEGADYLDVVERACRRAEGTTMPLVAVHADLTSINVLAEGDGLGIVDWEHASGDGLPLTDFLYAAADLAAAVDRHRDRLAAFEDCFAPGRRWTELLARLERRLRDAIGLSDDAAAVCFHACWAHHAANELRASGGRPGEFVALAGRAAALRP